MSEDNQPQLLDPNQTADMERTQQLETVPSPSVPEQATQPPEYVESFVDKNGVERKTDYPLVMLDHEACEAIKGYFDDHNQLAKTVSEQLDGLNYILTQKEQHYAGKTIFGLALGARQFVDGPTQSNAFDRYSRDRTADQAEQEDKVLEQDVLSAFGLDEPTPDQATAQKTEIDPASLSDQDKKLLELQQQRGALEQQVQFIQSHVSVHQLSPDGEISAERAKSLFDSLPPDLKQTVEGHGVDTKLGLKGRFSADHREDFAMGLHRALRDLTEHAQTDINSLNNQIVQGVTTQLIERVQEEAKQLNIQTPEVDVYRHRVSEEEPIASASQTIASHGEQLGVVVDEAREISSSQEVIHESVASSPLLQIVSNLPADQRRSLAKSLLADLRTQEIARSEQLQKVDHFMGETVTATASAAALALGSATSMIYTERALPIEYISPTEVENLQALYDKFNQVVNTQISQYVKRVTNKQGQDGYPLYGSAEDTIKRTEDQLGRSDYDGDTVMFHATSFVKQIVESGALMPKQEQVEKLGTVHGTTHTVDGYGRDAYSHSTVPHFSTSSPNSAYITPANELKDGIALVPGVVAMSIGEIIKHAPIDMEGYQLTQLPATEMHKSSSAGSHFYGQGIEARENDFVFYGSDSVEARDDYTLPLSGGDVFILGDVPEGVQINVPAELKDRVHTGFPDPYDGRGDTYKFAEIVRQAEAAARQRHDETFVVPLRRSNLPASAFEFSGRTSGPKQTVDTTGSSRLIDSRRRTVL